ncbi:hypothetical protein [Kineococcus indalonis]|uniref:hypothetical protein n=1 Tax=Kineococcus indalonis TaxID=2696566 RepID=UPI001412B2B3|nr:hypothetical protein [Kineococcus indalonis]NAZ86090.1 hypothetical protein [Kineococcus indalonis]
MAVDTTGRTAWAASWDPHALVAQHQDELLQQAQRERLVRALRRARRARRDDPAAVPAPRRGPARWWSRHRGLRPAP